MGAAGVEGFRVAIVIGKNGVRPEISRDGVGIEPGEGFDFQEVELACWNRQNKACLRLGDHYIARSSMETRLTNRVFEIIGRASG